MCERRALSSNHFGLESQIADILGSAPRAVREGFHAEFPEWMRLQWSYGSVDWEKTPDVDPDLASHMADWIEASDQGVRWEEGEPFLIVPCQAVEAGKDCPDE
jgi:hypothetical protein